MDNKHICLRCNHVWYGRTDNKPVKCPKCISPYWDRPRQRITIKVSEEKEG